MAFRDHLRTTGSALWDWFVAQCCDSLAVAVLWLVGLEIIGVPWAPLWAALAGVLQFVPHLGGPLALIFPAIASLSVPDHRVRFFYVLMLFVAIMLVDGFFLQPYLMKRTAKVPFWAALLTPIAVALLIPAWWAILLAPPLLAVVFALWRSRRGQRLPKTSSTTVL